MGGFTPVEFIFWGAQAVVTLLVFYGLFEWGGVLSQRVLAGTLTRSKAYNYFGFAAVFLSLAPVAVTMAVLAREPIGNSSLIHQGDDFGAARFYIAAFAAGLVLQLLSYGMFYLLLKKKP